MSGSFDTIIIGAGSSGCVLAARLSQSAGHRVLLLEAGPDQRVETLPDELTHLGRGVGSPYEWGEQVESIRGRRLAYLRGRGVGGSSAINGGVAIRPEPADFDAWPSGWQWEDMLPSFVAAEHDLDFPEAPWHGDSGPIPIVRMPEHEWSPLQSRFYQASRELGFPDCPDHNAPFTTGVGPIPMNREGTRRMSCVVTHLEGARSRANLSVRADAHVRKIRIDQGRAVGVELVGGETLAANEIIVSAGVLQSPLLLQRSGVGAADALRKIGIEPLVDAPAVGENWTDHTALTFTTPIDPALLKGGRPGLCHLIRTTSESSSREHDLQLTPYVQPGGDGGIDFCVSVSMQQPAGRARLAATSADPAERARISWPFASEPENRAGLRWGWRNMARIVERMGVALDSTAVQSAGAFDDADLDEFIALEHTAFYHGVGTCAMGDSADCVVDPDCRVRGVEALRVIDTSVVPTVPRSNTHMLAVALAERMAEKIMEG